eukprot:scaffold250557_cov54-Attheya_sp.AAC.3
MAYEATQGKDRQLQEASHITTKIWRVGFATPKATSALVSDVRDRAEPHEQRVFPVHHQHTWAQSETELNKARIDLEHQRRKEHNANEGTNE